MSTSSPTTSSPSSSRPNSNFVSARITPRSRACSAAKRYSSIETSRTRAMRSRSPDQLRGALEVDRLVVALVGLGGRGEDRCRQALGLAQARRQLDAGDAPGGLVVLPARAGDVAAHHALDGQHPQLAHRHRAPADVLGDVLGGRHVVVLDDVAGAPEPEGGQAGEHRPLVRDRRGMHDVIRRDPVAGDHQDAVAEVVHLSDLPAGDEREVGYRRHGPQASNAFGRPRARVGPDL